MSHQAHRDIQPSPYRAHETYSDEHTATPHDRDLYTESPSTGWEETCAILEVDSSVEPPKESREAARRQDRPERYRRKHALEVSS